MARRPNDLPELWDESTVAADREREANKPKGSRLRLMTNAVLDEVIPREGAGATLGNSLFAIPSARVAAPSTGGTGLRLLKSARDAKNFRPNQTVAATSRGFRNRGQIVSGNKRQIAGNIADAATTAVRTPFSITGAAGLGTAAVASDLARDGEERYAPPERANSTSATGAAEGSTDPDSASNNTSTPPQARSLLRRMEDGEQLTQADFNAAGYDGRGIRIDGGRQGVGAQTFGGDRRASEGGGAAVDADGYGPAIPVTANSRFEALRNRRLGNTTQEERRAGLRAGQERLALRREAFGDEPTAKEALRRSLEGGMGRAEVLERRAVLTEAQRQAEAAAMGEAATVDTTALQSARGLREEARQADQTTAAFERESQRRLMSEGLRAQGGGSRSGSGGGSVLGPGGNYSPENVASQAATQMPSIMANLQRSGLSDFYETPEAAQGSFQNFLGDAARAQSRGALPEWMDDRTIEDVFTLSHALAGAETKGVLGRIGAALPFVKPSRGTSGEMNISSTDTLQSLLNVMRAEDGDKWTDANGTSFQLSTVRGPSAQIYQRLKDQFREAGLLNETEE